MRPFHLAAPLVGIGAFLASGCFESRVTTIDGGRVLEDGHVVFPDTGPPPPPPRTDQLDLLVVMDDSSSLGEEHASFQAQIPRLLTALRTGDFDGDPETVGPDDFRPFDSVHYGVVTTDMGTGGFTIPTCDRSDFGQDGLLRTTSRGEPSEGCMPSYPRFLDFREPFDLERAAVDATCLAEVGIGGCGFEQPLEAALKALSPSMATRGTAPDYEPPRFFRNTLGHGDRANEGFVRESSLLAVVIFSDEEDCSAADPELFNPSSRDYGSTDLGLRCWAHGDVGLHRISRYADGLRQLRRNPARLVYYPIVGIPPDLAPGGLAPDYERLVGDTDVRDHRLIEQPDPAVPSRLTPSCDLPGRGLAFPPVRMLRLAEALDARGARASVGSICRADLTPAFDRLLRLLGRDR
ncbi:MAG TPA: hypothetical protein RMH99_15375 [Sandaracinaceae bacterium LLY-WYZ-13_1]|nr:hypothetical protein [Sandaracinaceae bacterium LLY-WYZ-13_1]